MDRDRLDKAASRLALGRLLQPLGQQTADVKLLLGTVCLPLGSQAGRAVQPDAAGAGSPGALLAASTLVESVPKPVACHATARLLHAVHWSLFNVRTPAGVLQLRR